MCVGKIWVLSGLSIFGERVTGQDVRTQNVTAAMAIANIVKSSLGPVGLDKMLVDELGDVTITNDGATILSLLEVEHPAGRVLVELANLQDKEVGDGTTTVVILAAELLKRANELVKNGIHPTNIIAGYMMAKHEACKFIAEQISQKVDTLGVECLLNCAKTSMSSKILDIESDLFSKMVVSAVQAIKTEEIKGKPKYPISYISIIKAHGASLHESKLINGYALELTRASQQMPRNIKNAKIAFIDVDLRKAKMALGVQILVKDPEEVINIQKKEADITHHRINLLINAGANVILTTKGIDDQALKHFVNNNCIAVRRVDKKEMKHLAAATGGTMIISMADMEGNEFVDSSALGSCELVNEERVGDYDMLFFYGCKTTRSQTILIRGANDFMMDEIERSIHDALSIVQRTLESNFIVPGGGCCETALSVYLEQFAETLASREQVAIAEFAQALLVIPKTLAVNGAFDSTELVSLLRAYHSSSQNIKNPKTEYKYYGLDLINGKVRNCVTDGVLEPSISKVKAIRFATEAAISLLRIDDSIKMQQKVDPKGPHGR